jgi:hypothetical protein
MPLIKAVPPVEPIQTTFATAQEAFDYRETNGGWVAVSDQCSNGFWFSPDHFTATTVMMHPVLSGKSATLY